jgi:glutathione S-transferase
VLTELPAILFYLAGQSPSASLLPDNPGGLGRCLEWLNWLSGTVHSLSFGQVWRPQRLVNHEELFPSIVEKGRKNIIENYAYIEQQLTAPSGQSMLNSYGIVHPVLLVFWIWGRWIDVDMGKNYPTWTLLVNSIVERPAVQRALSTEGIDLKLFK